MKKLYLYFLVAPSIALLSMNVAAQTISSNSGPAANYPRYELFDLGTFGGPNSATTQGLVVTTLIRIYFSLTADFRMG